MAFQSIAERIAEKCKSRNIGGIWLRGHFIAVFGHSGIHGPSLSIENDIRMGFVNFCDDLVDRFGVDQSDKVKTETVDVVFVCPVFDRVYNILSHHGTLGGSVISTVGAVGVCSILVYPGKIARYDLIYTEI